MIFQIVLFYVLPGSEYEGLPVAEEGGASRKYKCNGLLALFVTVVAFFLGISLRGEREKREEERRGERGEEREEGHIMIFSTFPFIYIFDMFISVLWILEHSNHLHALQRPPQRRQHHWHCCLSRSLRQGQVLTHNHSMPSLFPFCSPSLSSPSILLLSFPVLPSFPPSSLLI